MVCPRERRAALGLMPIYDDDDDNDDVSLLYIFLSKNEKK